MRYIATLSHDSTVVAAGFKLSQQRGHVHETLLVQSSDPRLQMRAAQLQALVDWLRTSGAQAVRTCTAADLLHELDTWEQPDTPLLANVTGGTKELSELVITAVPPGTTVLVLDAHGSLPAVQDLTAGTRTAIPGQAWLSVQDLKALNFYPGAPFTGKIVHQVPATKNAFTDVLTLLTPEDLKPGVLLVHDVGQPRNQNSAPRPHVPSIDPSQIRSAVIVMRQGRAVVIATRRLRDPKLPWGTPAQPQAGYTPEPGERNVREALRNHREITRRLAGDTGVAVFLKREREKLPDIKRGNRTIFKLTQVLTHYASHYVSGLAGIRLPAPAPVSPPDLSDIRPVRTLVLLIGFQAMPQVVAALSTREGHLPPEQVLLIATQETKAVAQQIEKVVGIPCVTLKVGANQPDQVTRIIEKAATLVTPPLLEVNITGGLQSLAAQAIYAARQVGAAVTYTDGFTTRTLGEQASDRVLGNVLSIQSYFAALGYRARTVAEIDLKQAKSDLQNARTSGSSVIACMVTANAVVDSGGTDDTRHAEFVQALTEAQATWLQVKDQDNWPGLLRQTKPGDRVGFAYECSVLLGLLMGYLGSDQEPHLWKVAWSVNLKKAAGSGELGTHELDIVLLTSQGPAFLEVKHSVTPAIERKNAHLRLADIRRVHGARYVSAALVTNLLRSPEKDEIWRALRTAHADGVRFLTTTRDCGVITVPQKKQSDKELREWAKKNSLQAGLYRVDGRDTILLVHTQQSGGISVSVLRGEAQKVIREAIQFLPQDLPRIDALW